MIAEIGRWLLLFGFAISVVSMIVVAVLQSLGLPPPDLLVRFAALPRLITGTIDLGTLANFVATIGFGIGAYILVNVLSRLFRFGEVGMTNFFQVKALATYLAIWVPFADGVSLVLRGLGWHLAMLYPGPVSNAVWTFFVAAEAIAKFLVAYYLATRVLGLPSE